MSTSTLTGPLTVVVESLDNRDVAVTNPDGYTRDGKPYFEYPQASLGARKSTAGRPWKLEHRCGKKVSATVKPFTTAWQLTVQPACSPLLTVHVSVFSAEGGANHAPVAEAGVDQTVKAGTVVALDGSRSTDEDGDPLTYRWSVVSRPAGGKVTLTGAASVRPTVKFNLAGTYVLGLTVRDGALTSARDTCTLTTLNSRPVADAGADRTVELGPVRLDAGGSTDADGDRLGYAWSIVAMPPGAEPNLTGATAVRPSFMADTPGEYVLQLVVSHGTKKSLPDFCRISTVNSRPRADAGAERKVAPVGPVRLDGAGSSDADGDPLTHRWAILSRPPGSVAALADPASVRPSFNADAAGTYVVQLVVNDGRLDSVPATAVVTTANARPAADAGRDRTAGVGMRVTLDGRGSLDPDGGALAWKWSLLSVPRGSLARLAVPTTARPSFRVDKAGTYVVQLGVSDGALAAPRDTVVVDTRTSPPAADAGADQDVFSGATVDLDGGGSSDPDGDWLTPFWAMLVRPPGSAAALSDPAVMAPSFTADLPGTYVLQLAVRDDEFASAPDTVAITATVRMVLVPDVVGTAQAAAESAITAALLAVGAITAEHSETVPAGSVITQVPAAGSSVAEGSAVNLVVSLGPEVFTVPDVVGLQRTAAEGAIAAAGLVAGAVTQRFSETVPAGAVISQEPAGGTVVAPASPVSLVLSLGPVFIPPDPATVAPPLDQTVAAALSDAASFLYSGSDPVQLGVAPGTIDPRRVAVIRGMVVARDGSPLPGVVIAILDHPEFGETVSRADGMFDMAVNGGGHLTIRYRKKGYLEAQRQIGTPWEDYVWAPDVALVVLDTVATEIDLTAPTPIQVAQGSVTSDERGDRRSTLLFPQGTGAQIILPDGSARAISTLTVRSTEYTVGENGPKAMPAVLPPGVEYTYAVELSVDEALAAGAESVRFSQPVVQYVENFLGFAIGARVPVYYYDRERGIWVPSPDGRVIGILSIAGGLAEVDTNGDGVADDDARLAALGITDAERERLGTLYAAGQTLWRAASDHFSPRDLNWPAPPNPPTPEELDVDTERIRDKDCTKKASIIGCMNQTLGESMPIVGTPFTLNYSSDRVQGRKSAYRLEIPLSGDTVPAKVVGIELEILVAGRRFVQSFPPSPHQSYTFAWDGLDAYGRPVQGGTPVLVKVGYKYTICYWQCVWNETEYEWSCWENCPTPPVGFGNTWSTWSGTIGVMSQLGLGLGGWSLDVNHLYDARERVLYEGTGGRRSAEHVGAVISTAAGTRDDIDWADWSSYREPDIKPAKNRAVTPYGIATGPDGSIYVADLEWGPPARSRVIRVYPDGSSIVVAGKAAYCRFWISDLVCYPPGFSGDGGPATQAQLGGPFDVAVGPDGSLYIADLHSNRIRRVSPDGIITTVAGNGSSGNAGDGGPATQASLQQPSGLACAPDGTLYIVTGSRVRRVSPDGIISTVPGTEDYWECGNASCDATTLWQPHKLAVGPDGSLYMAGGASLRRLDPAGNITTVAGGCAYCDPAADGEPAVGAKLAPHSVAVGRDGNLYLGDSNSRLVRMVRPDGTIVTVAGGAAYTYGRDDGVHPQQAYLGDPVGIAADPGGDLLIADLYEHRIRKIGPPLSGFSVNEIVLPSEDAEEVGAFGGDGRHLRTMNALTGQLRYAFTYDAEGRMAGVTDSDGNITTVERDDSGNPTAIVGPFGARTRLAVDSHGYLAGVANPAGETTSFVYTADGLLTAMTVPNGHTYNFTYDAFGGLIRDEDPLGGFQTLARTELENGYQVTRTSATGEATTYKMETLASGDRTITTAGPCCGTAEVVEGADGTLTSTMPDGMVATTVPGPDPRFGMQSPLTMTGSVRTPGGLALDFTMRRDVSLRNQADPLSVSSYYETTSINGRSYSSSYSASSRTRTRQSPAGRQVFTVNDEAGRPTSLQIDGLDPVEMTYDSRGRLSTMTAGSGAAARPFSFDYDSDGNLASFTDPLYRVTTYEHDEAGRLIGKTLPDGRVVSFTYDANGNLTSLTPPGRPLHAFAFNAVDLPLQYTPPPLGSGSWSTTYVYDLDRRLTAINRPGGESVSLTYSPGGKLQTIATPEGDYSFVYHPTSRNVSSIVAPGGGALAFTYDGNLLLSQAWTGEVVGRIDRTFDNNFRVVSRSVNGGDAIAFGYDDDSLLVQAGGLTIARSFQNQLITETALGSVADTRSYNPLGEPAGYAATYDAAPLVSFEYERDRIGRVSEVTETVGENADVYGYAYDAAGRLLTVTKNTLPFESFTYDSNGNRLSATTQAGMVSGTYDDQDRLLEYGGTTYAYSANGDLLAKTIEGQTTSYDYDALGNLRSVALPGGTGIAYVVDGLNRRIGKKVNGALVQGFLYDTLLHPQAELDGSGTVISRFVYGTRGNVPDHMIKGGKTYRIISDHLGSPRLVVDVSTGDIAQEIEYDSFGNVLSDSNPGFQPFGFAGGLYDRDTKLTRFGARDYDAETGRWTAKDPIRFAGGAANLYGYVLNDPINLVDANGKIPVVIVPIIVAVATHPEIVVGVVTAVVNEVTGTSQPYDPETAKWEALTTAVIKLIEEANETRNEYAALGEELDRLLEQVRKTREGAEMTREELERLLEELKRMFPCHKSKKK